MAEAVGIATLGELLAQAAADDPARVGWVVVRGDGSEEPLTFGEAAAAARRFAGALLEQGRPGDRVAILQPTVTEHLGAVLGCLWAGMAPVSSQPPEGFRGTGEDAALRALAGHAGAHIVLAPEALAGRLAVDRATRVVAPAADGPAEPVAASAGDVAYLQATSGSSGGARAVALSHRALLANLRLQQRLLPFGSDAVLVSWLALSHDMGFVAPVLQPLFSRTRAVLLSPLRFLLRPVRWLEAITAHGGTIAGGPNFGYELVARRTTYDERDGLDLSTWTCAVNGAEPLDPRTLRRFTRAFAPVGFSPSAFTSAYGLAEATSTVTTGRPGRPPVVVRADADALRAGVLTPAGDEGGCAVELVGNGATDDAHEVRIVDDAGAPCEDGRIGEIWVRGPGVAQGYADGGTEGFGARAADGSEAWLRTGDLGTVYDGELFVTGRRKDLIIVRGRNHAPHDIERTALGAHPELADGLATAFGVGDPEVGEAVVVAVEAGRGGSATVAELAAVVRAAVAEDHGVEVATVIVMEPGGLPRTTSGKVRRRPTADAYATGSLERVVGTDDRRGGS